MKNYTIYITSWSELVDNNLKLELYKYIKHDFVVESYITIINNVRNRSLLTRLRSGCLDLEIEIGRWRGKPKEDRICQLCSITVENEIHFIFDCIKLKHIRQKYKYVEITNNPDMTDKDKFRIIFLKHNIRITEKLVRSLYDERKCILYS